MISKYSCRLVPTRKVYFYDDTFIHAQGLWPSKLGQISVIEYSPLLPTEMYFCNNPKEDEITYLVKFMFHLTMDCMDGKPL